MMVRIILIASLLVFSNCSKKGDQKEEATAVSEEKTEKKQQSPDFPIVFSSGEKKSFQALPGKIVLILFQPDCDHCQREATDIERHLSSFKDFKLYFVSSAPMEEIKSFANNYKLSDKPNVEFGYTDAANIINQFGPVEAPSIYLYSEDKSLIESFNGEVAIEVVLKYI